MKGFNYFSALEGDYDVQKSVRGVALANAKVVIYVVIYAIFVGMLLTNLQCL